MRATNTLVSFCARTFGDRLEQEVDMAPQADDLDIVETFAARERKRERRRSVEMQTNPLKPQKEQETS